MLNHCFFFFMILLTAYLEPILHEIESIARAKWNSKVTIRKIIIT